MPDLAMLLLVLTKVPWEIVLITPQKTMISSQVTLRNWVILFDLQQHKSTATVKELGGYLL